MRWATAHQLLPNFRGRLDQLCAAKHHEATHFAFIACNSAYENETIKSLGSIPFRSNDEAD
jgi:hypothetical protein